MATVPPAPPPPPPPPSSCGNQAFTTHSTPLPQHAALPFNMEPPIQETSLPDGQGAEALPIPPVPSNRQKYISSGGADPSSHPVQETDPAPQALGAPQIPVQQDEQDPPEQDHLE